MSQYIKNVVLFERVRPRSRSEPSPLDALKAAAAETPPVVLVQYTHLQLVAAPPASVHALENHRCRLG